LGVLAPQVNPDLTVNQDCQEHLDYLVRLVLTASLE